MRKAVHGFVTGQVQGVGYRQACRRMARSLDLVGWVRNRRDGRVEVHAQGADDSVNQIIDWLWQGSSSAHVTGVETEIIAMDDTLTDFFIQPDEKT